MLTVLSVAYPFAPVSLDATGGAEQILAIIDDELVSRGHRSIVIAPEGSEVRGELVEGPRPLGKLDERYREPVHAHYRHLLDEAIRAHSPDIVHMHGLDAAAYLPEKGPPLLVTLHLPPSFYEPGSLQTFEKRGAFLNCVSEAQRKSFPRMNRMLEVVPNGIRVEDYDGSLRKDSFVLSLGRICPEKGYHLALDAARLANVPMMLAGQVFPYEAHDRYFLTEVVPRLDEHRRFIGPVGVAQKKRLLASARCLLIPSRAEETSSLVAMEALASQTPVIAHRVGALPELLEDQVTGYLVETVEDMAAAILRADGLDRSQFREVAETRFSSRSMVSKYLDRYEQILHFEAKGPWNRQPAI